MKKILAIIAAVALGLGLHAQSVQVDAPSAVENGEQFDVSVSVSASESFKDPQWEPGEDFQVVWGPQQVQSGTSISIVNGKRTSSINKTYRYILLAKKEGTFTLPPVTVNCNGTSISSRQVRIEVVKAGTNTAPAQQSQSAQGGQRAAAGGNNFLKLSVSKTDVMVGEPVTATLKLYAGSGDIIGFEDAKFPTFNGFWSQKTYNPERISFREENYEGKHYVTAVLGEYVLIPQQTGDITIEPASITCVSRIVVTPSTGMGSLFDSMFEDVQQVKKRAVSSGYTMHVKPLPIGAPESFNGAVGTFTIGVAPPEGELKTHEASSLKITVSGNGNISMVEAPKVKFPSDFETYDVKQTESIDASFVHGSKTFEYPFIPRSYGEFEIPPVEFSFYDNSQGRYVTVKTKSVAMSVAKSKATDTKAEGGMIVNSSARKVANLGSDIRYISTSFPKLRRAESFFALSPLYFGIAGGLLLLFAVLLLTLRKRAAQKADVALTRNKGAVKMAKKRLSLAGDFLQKNLSTAYYEELHRALLGYAGDKLTIDPASLSKENIGEKLSERGVSEVLCNRFTSLLESCEFARYSPEGGTEAMASYYSEALDIITSIESSMKTRFKLKKGAAAAMLLLLMPFAGFAQEGAEGLWNEASAHYAAGEWNAAFESYSQIEQMGLESAQLYCNMGDAAYKADRLSLAILYYERALRLDNTYADAKHNLAFANNQIQDRVDEVPELFLKTWIKGLSHVFRADVWAVISLLALALGLAALLIFLLSGSSGFKKTGFYVSIVSAAICLTAFVSASSLKAEYFSEESAIVMNAVSSVKSSPGSEGGQELFVLHEGIKVRVLDEVGTWKNIRLTDGRQGWIKASDIAII